MAASVFIDTIHWSCGDFDKTNNKYFRVMKINGTYQDIIESKNIECILTIENKELSVSAPIKIFGQIKQPKNKKDFRCHEFSGNKNFSYTHIIKYIDTENKDIEIFAILSKKEAKKIDNILNGVWFRGNQAILAFVTTAIILAATIILFVIQNYCIK
ncbi:hypothetical protein [Draconibacterium halophilum]|uniref:Uncharacterized protein n=1 Tax=Draconibacterium halophilum TaxID=2706887 RepID=A0A6C0RGZ0_9BACT|nr:hypothetical protein [Draconibacterium halophilum]QIA08803.1 hypothetical protein G0Q07_14220 [Draconibacterium halophilum]